MKGKMLPQSVGSLQFAGCRVETPSIPNDFFPRVLPSDGREGPLSISDLGFWILCMRSFEILFNAARPALWHLAVCLTRGDREDAEDLVQDCAAATCEHFADYDGALDFAKWASTILYR